MSPEPCNHPDHERAHVSHSSAGYLGVPEGVREVCEGCGTDFGPVEIAQ